MTTKSDKYSMEKMKGDTAVGSVWPGILVIAGGVILLGLNLFDVAFPGTPWPLFIIGPGALLLLPAFQLRPGESHGWITVLAAGGAVLATIGLILALAELINHYEGWAYAWTLLPAVGTAGIIYANRFNLDSPIHQAGRGLIRLMLAAFVGLAVFFELFIFSGHERWWPVLLIAVGVYLMVRPRRYADEW